MNSESQITTPAAMLLIVGVLNLLFSFLTLLSGLIRILVVNESLPMDEAERAGYLFATVSIYGIAFVSLVFSPLIIFGAVQFLKHKRRGIVKAAAITALLPVSSCCFVFGIPIGIWVLIVLGRSEVKALFDGTLNLEPPVPPRF